MIFVYPAAWSGDKHCHRGGDLFAICKGGDYVEYLDRRFFRCLRSVIINFEQVQAMRDQTIYFENGKSFMLGRTNYISTKQAFAAYLKKLPM